MVVLEDTVEITVTDHGSGGTTFALCLPRFVD